MVFETASRKGVTAQSFFQWRIKESLDGNSFFIALKMKPDGYAGAEGSPTNYMNFDLETAELLRDDLEECIQHFRWRRHMKDAAGTEPDQ